MFIFLAVHLSSHPSYPADNEDADRLMMDKIWRELADNKVLFAPGWGFDARGEHNIGGAGSGVGYFRLSYSVATYEQVRRAVQVLKEVLVKTLGQE
jgi:aromatic amino acid aminotransferase I